MVKNARLAETEKIRIEHVPSGENNILEALA